MNWQLWGKGLAAAAIGGGATAAAAAVGTGHSLNYHELGATFLAGAAVALLAYLAKSPLPSE